MTLTFTFTENPELVGEYRFGGELTISADGVESVAALIDHFELFRDLNDPESLKARIAALESESLTHVLHGKRPFYEIDSALDHEFTAPYETWAKRCFGYDGQFPNLEIPRKWSGLVHTNYQARLYTDNGHICFLTYVSSEPWAKKTAFDYAESRALDYIGEEFGTRYQEPEFLAATNGQYTRNPNYLKRHRAKPAASNSRLKRAFFDWWCTNVANDAQKAIIAGNERIAAGASYMSAFTFNRHESHIYYDKTAKDYKSVTFDEFAALGCAQC